VGSSKSQRDNDARRRRVESRFIRGVVVKRDAPVGLSVKEIRAASFTGSAAR
jgi:hypothetical protein